MASEPGHRVGVHGPRPGAARDRRGRGPRGVMSLPGPLSPGGAPIHRTPRQAFDDLVAEILTRLHHHVAREPDRVEVAVEEAPLLPASWDDPVPHSIVTPAPGGHRIVLYRLPIVGRARSGTDLEELVWTVLLTRLGEVWHHDPDDLDPRG